MSMTNQTITLGDFELTSISDGNYYADGGAFFGVVPKVLWQRKVQADDRNRIAVGLNSVLIRTGKQNVLIETGIGNKLPEKSKKIWESEEKLLENLHAAGLTPEDIHIVINSHLHFDHCGWNTVYKNGAAVATFPNAKYYAPEGEWKHGSLQLERDRVSYISDNFTRHMQAIIITSGGKTACYISDLIPTTWHLDVTWVMAYDLFPLEVIENRKRYYQQALPEDWLTLFTHDPDVPWARLSESGGKMAVRSM